jgi:hypothetical protein
MSKNISLKQQLEAFKNGTILASDGTMDWCFNFYDWFCKDSSLENKAKRLFPMVAKFVNIHREIDTEKVYVFFKNNCPVNGPLYDDFRICDRETGDVLWTVIPKSGHSGMFEAYSRSYGFSEPVYKGKNITEALKPRVRANKETDAKEREWIANLSKAIANFR